MRFIPVQGTLEYQWDTGNDGNFTAITAKERYTSIDQFIVCGDTDMLAGGCPIEPTAISTFHSANISDKGNRYFRFRVRSAPLAITGLQPTQVFYQGAFFGRNQVGSPVYQW